MLCNVEEFLADPLTAVAMGLYVPANTPNDIRPNAKTVKLVYICV